MPFLKIPDFFLHKKPPTCSTVIAAAGNSRRCKGEDKLLYCIDGKPVLAHSISMFENCSFVKEIIVVAGSEQLETFAQVCKNYGYKKVTKIITGGDTRTHSVYNGVFAVSSKAEYIAIHDGARPLVDTAIIENTLKKAALYCAAAPGLPIVPTIKRASVAGNKSDHTIIISETIDRSGLYEIQTPQIFKAEIIKAALTNAINKNIAITDDCMAVELLGMPVHITEGSRMNIKITVPDDLLIAQALMNRP